MQKFFLKNELTALDHHTQASNPIKRRFVKILRAVITFNALLIICVAMFSAITYFDIRELASEFNTPFYIFFYLIPVFVMLPYTIMLHFQLLFKTLLYSANTITRERTPARWDTLALTGVTAQPVIFGKWIACILHMSREYAFLALLRAASLIYITVIANRLDALFFPSQPISLRPDFYLRHPAMPFFSVAFLLLLTLINLPLTASFGILGGFINSRHGLIASGIIRALVLVAFSAFFILMSVLYGQAGNLFVLDATLYTIDGVWVNTLFAIGEGLVTNGAGVGVDLLFNRGYQETLTLHAIYGGIGLLIIYSALTLLNLQLSKWLAKRQGLL